MVERCQDKRWPIRKPKWDPIDVLHYAMDEMGHTQTELAEILGSRSRASEILSRQRALTTEMTDPGSKPTSSGWSAVKLNDRTEYSPATLNQFVTEFRSASNIATVDLQSCLGRNDEDDIPTC